MIDLAKRKVLVVGLGMSGLAAARAASDLGAKVTVIDSSMEPARADSVGELEKLGVEVLLGVTSLKDMSTYDLLVASPGVPGKAAPLEAARAAGIKVISELELGYRLLDNEFVAVTGTNGKTTTTELAAKMLTDGERVAVTCGNIGNPVAGLAGEVSPDDILVAEVSSFQLANIEEFSPRVAVLLNIAPDHYDWHTDFDDYFEAKARLIENQETDDVVVYNEEDGHCRAIALRARSKPVGFEGAPGSGLWVEHGKVIAGPPLFDDPIDILTLSKVKLTGRHNLHNMMAAAALAMGAGLSRVREVAATFEGLEHRMERVLDVEGVVFYNDSKATNPHASLHALASFPGPLVLILGGRNKGLDFAELSGMIASRVADGSLAGVVLMGESAGEIRRSIGEASVLSGRMALEAQDLQDAVEKAFSICPRPGVVLFSPACASFDMFDDYMHRGRAFKEALGGLYR